MRPTVAQLIAFVCVISLLAGCRKEKATEERARKFELVKPFAQVGAPVTVTVKASRKEITIADFLTLVIETKAAKGSMAELPELKDLNFGQFLVKDHYRLSSREENDSQIEAIEFTLEPQLSGEYTIAPFKVTYTVEGELPNGEGQVPVHEIETESLTIVVKSLGADSLETAKLRDIQPPVLLPEPRRSRTALWAAMGAFFVVAGGVVAVVLAKRRRKKAHVEKRIPAHILAFEELRRLREMDLIGQGKIKEFYIAISDIMRFYIERRFGIHAPEQTTEEFLEAVSRNGVFDVPTRSTLKEFMSHCDMVKFAKYRPETTEIQKAIDITRDFIEQTKEEGAR